MLRCAKLLTICLLPKCGLRLTRANALAVESLPKACHLLSRPKLLAVQILPKVCQSLRTLQALPKQCLTQSGLLLGRAHLLPIALLADGKRLLRELLLRCTVCLLCCQIDALLLLERAKSLPVTALQEICECLLIGEVLLIGKVCLCNASAVAAESTGPETMLKAKKMIPYLN